MASKHKTVSFVVFFFMWARRMQWNVPDIHVLICHWLEHRGRIGVLEVFRGGSKSTIVAIYEAWKLYRDRTHRFLNQSADDPTAYKLSRDVKRVLKKHPLCRGMLPDREVAVERFSVEGAEDARNPSVAAHGILSNVTSSRANEVVFDDVEVPKNIRSPESRGLLRNRISESTHILLPNGMKLYIGTPHAHNSIYDEQVAQGADVMKIPLFRHHVRYENVTNQKRFTFNFKPGKEGLFVFHGPALLREGKDYEVEKNSVILKKTPGGLLDIYAGCAWPDRFNREEIALRRKECKTTNEWDSQYQLEAKPIHQIRLNPDRLRIYEVEPTIRFSNGSVSMWLGKVQIVGASMYWDPALGKIGTNDSLLSLMLTDAKGHLYWQQAQELLGDIEEQCKQVRDSVIHYQLENVSLETNGPGTFVPPLLRKALKGTGCGVREVNRSTNKDEYILDALEAPLSGQFLWANAKLWQTKMPDQMRDWIPGVPNQPDDYLDSAAGAIKQTPIRIGRVIGNVHELERHAWRPSSGQTEVAVDLH